MLDLKNTAGVLVTATFAVILLYVVVVLGQQYYSSSVVMNATVSHFISIIPSDDALERGVLFGGVYANTNNNMAENDTTGTGNVTDYWIEADPSNTANILLWHYAPDMDRQGQPPTIAIGNVSYEANQTLGVNVNMTLTTDGTELLTTSWTKIDPTNTPCDNLAPGSRCYIAFWLDVPSAILAGTYNTTYYFCGNISVTGSPACS